jgi:hypothetical protein
MSMFSFVKRVLSGGSSQPKRSSFEARKDKDFNEVDSIATQLQRPTKEVPVRKRNAKGQFIA